MDRQDVRDKQYSRKVSPTEFFWLSIGTFGFYTLFWIYRLWKFVKEENQLKISPLFRTIFTLFFVGALVKEFKILMKKKEIALETIDDLSEADVMGLYIGLSLVAKFLPYPISILSVFSFVAFYPLLKYVNEYADLAEPDLPERSLNFLQVIVVIIISAYQLVGLGIELYTFYMSPGS